MVCYYLLVCFHLSLAHVISLLWISFIQHLQPIALQWLPKDDLTMGHKPADSLWSCHHSVTVIYDLPVSDVRPWEALWICCSDVIFVPVNYITYRLARPPNSVVSPWIHRLHCTGRYITPPWRASSWIHIVCDAFIYLKPLKKKALIDSPLHE